MKKTVFLGMLVMLLLVSQVLALPPAKYQRSALTGCDEYPCVLMKAEPVVAPEGLQEDYVSKRACRIDLARVQLKNLAQLNKISVRTIEQRIEYDKLKNAAFEFYTQGKQYCASIAARKHA